MHKRGNFRLWQEPIDCSRIPSVCMASNISNPVHDRITKARFDTDSVPVAIDNCASSCMTNDINDFVPGTQKEVSIPVDGLGQRTATIQGTVVYQFEDDQGGIHSFSIPNTTYLMDLKQRLFSPQHWAQVYGQEAHSRTDANNVVLSWSYGRYRKTIPLNRSNVAMTRTATGFRRFSAHQAETTEHEHPVEHMCFPAYVSDDEDDPTEEPRSDDEESDHSLSPEGNNNEDPPQTEGGTPPLTRESAPARQGPTVIDFNDEEQSTPTQHPEKPLESKEMELLRWHKRLAHAPFSSLQHMARNGILPGRLRDCPQPFCAACQYGKQTRRPWRTKPGTTPSLQTAVRPGQCVSVDQMESTTNGFIAQLKGIPTKQRYRYATVFIDHFSRLSYVHLQKTLTSTETLEAKMAFEKFAEGHSVKIEHYHADNGRFADTLWLASVAKC